jgi:minor extracellular serine protease Vpr
LHKRLIFLVCLLLGTPVSALDKVRVETNVDAAIAKYGVSGKGVIVAIMDRGIDWLNNDFRNLDGTTRIATIFDLTDDTGRQGNIYGMGTLYSRAQINAALLGGPPLATRDAVGHGTATAGIAVGNGRNSPGTKYRGIAPNATIIIVKITSDGAPAHDDQPAEAPFFDSSRIPVAIDFIRAQAAALGMPCVMLLNLGSQGGPTDGTSSLARKIDSVVGPGIPGLVFVTGTGDDGGMPNRVGGTVAQGASAAIQIQKGASSSLYFDLWYAGTDRFDVTIASPSRTLGPYVSPATNDDFDVQTTSDFTYYQLGSSRTFFEAQNNKREIWIQLTGPPGRYTVLLQGTSVASGRFDATLNPSEFWNPPYNANQFLSFLSPGSIWDAATARNNIAPNCYTIRTSWIDVDGYSRGLSGQGNPGEIWPGSSVGPTFDGRLGVDVSAPGEEVVTAYNPKSYWATFRGNLIADGGGLYGMGGAVSAAAPVVTGVIALMLERNAHLDAARVKILLRNARADSFTGAVPNLTWGYGKLDALRIMDSMPVRATTGDFDGDGKSDITVFRPSNGTWYIRYSASGNAAGFQWGNGSDVPVPADYDGDGKTDVAVFRPSNGTWYIVYSSTGSAVGVQWGNGNDVPVPGDYDGDGKTDIAVFRPSNGTWYVVKSSTGTAAGVQWGNGNDVPVPGDYDGDGKTDIAVFRPSNGTWYVVYSGTGSAVGVQWGNGSDVPVPGDYDGDGKTDIAVFRPSNGTWYVINSSTGTATGVQWGNGNDVPVPGDYDGDGKTDLAVFRPSNGTWYVVNSSTGTPAGLQWGNGNDVPILKSP